MAVRLFVGNLPYDVTETELKELFSPVGTPSLVRIPTDRETGKPRGFAFVDFPDPAQAEEAVRRFDQQLFKGRPLGVNEARARDERPAARPVGPQRPAPASPPRAAWSGEPEPDEEGSRPGQPRRTFGPDTRSRDRRKREGRGGKGEERAPKRPIRERSGGQLFLGADEDDADEPILDDFARWAQEDGKDREED